MNFLLIVADTFRADYLGCYGNDWIETPNLDRLTSESAVFLDAYAEGLPTLPARRVMITGRPITPMRYIYQHSDLVQSPGWHPLYDEDVTAAEWLKSCGYHTAMFTDVYHMFKPGKNFHRGFDKWDFIRGQEDDRHALRDKEAVMDLLKQTSADAENMSEDHWVIQHLNNRKNWESDADTSVAKTMQAAADWISDYSIDKPFFMWVDCFDPHEPWDPPAEDAKMYYPDYEGLHGVFTPRRLSEGTEHVAECVKAAYAGEVTLVDRWVGRLLDTLEVQGYMDDTVIMFSSDHGTIMGEQDQLHKAGLMRWQNTRVPLIIRHPDGVGAGKQIEGFVQHQDFLPTALAMMGESMPERVMGQNVWPMAAEGAESSRDSILISWGSRYSLRTPEWNLIAPAVGSGAGNAELYELKNDPQELQDVIAEHPEVARELAAVANEKLDELRFTTTGSLQSMSTDARVSVSVDGS
ncbi:MAG: sulfatase [Armatimonadota bacterium]